MSKRFLVVLSVILALVMVTACGGGGASSGNGSSGGASSSGTSSGGTSSGGTSSGGGAQVAERSKTVRFAYGSKPRTLDPNDYPDNESQISFYMYMDSLIYTPHTGTGYEPRLAKSWEIDEDAMYWIFHLRDDVYFHNGQQFTADDVVFTYEYLLERKDTSRTLIAYMPQLEYVEKIDDFTVKIGFNVAYPLAGNGFRAIYIFPKGAYEEFGEDEFLAEHSYGTGPWIIQEWLDGQYTRYTKNPNYYRKDEFDSYFEEVYYMHSSEPSSIVAAMLANDIHVYAPLGGVPDDLLPLFDEARDRLNLVTVDTTMNYQFNFQMGDGKAFADENLRKAFNYAIDKQLLINQILGKGAVPKNYFREGIPGYNTGIEPYGYDLDLAMEYMAKTNYDGHELALMSNANVPKPEDTCLAIKDMVAKVGINLSVQVVDGTTFNARREERDFDLTLGQLAFPDGLATRMFNTILTDSGRTDYRNAAVLAAIADYNNALDDAARTPIVTQVVSMLEEDLYNVVIAYISATYAIEYGITGVDFYPDGMMNFCHIDFDPSLVP
ncbi:MAG: ABC transporter substrate-binding protein [Clostridiales bacterium]|nr:ABC transporter substrate-binding protein [Clostridiales bacterium]